MKQLMIHSFVCLCISFLSSCCFMHHMLPFCVYCYCFISSILPLGDKEIFFQRYGRYNIDKIWRDDIFPCRVYLRHWSVPASTYQCKQYSFPKLVSSNLLVEHCDFVVSWQLKILVIQPTTTFQIIPSLVTVELQYVSTC